MDAGTVTVNDDEYVTLLNRHQTLHPNMNGEERKALTVFFLVTRKMIPRTEQLAIGPDASNGVSRVALATEGVARDFRALRGAFDGQHQQLEAAKDAIAVGLAQQSKTITATLDQQSRLFEGAADQVARQVNFLNSNFASAYHEFRQDVKERWYWEWGWRIALLLVALLILGVVIAKADPEPEPLPVVTQGEFLRHVNAIFLARPLMQGGGVQAVRIVGNSANAPIYVSCVGGTCSGGGGGGGGTSSNYGDPFPAAGTAAGFIDSSGNMAGANLDSGGRLITTGAGGTFPVTGTFWQATQPISGAISFTAPQHVIVDSSASIAVTGPLTDTQLRASAVPVSPASAPSTSVTQGTSPWVVGQGTAANLNATVVGTGTFATQSAITAASGSIASGAVASGAVASGAYAAGAISDGADVTQGAKADAKSTATDTTAISVMSVLKEISAMEQAPASRAVTQATGTNLHAVLDTTSTTAVTQATGTNLHAVLDTTSTTAVTQATAANLNAAVVGTGTAGSAAGGVLTVQGVASMTKLLVTPDSVALPPNQSVNVAQINGATPLMGAGTTGTGSPRVTISTDQAALAAAGQGATGAAVPAGATYAAGIGSGNLTGDINCDNSVVYDTNTNGKTQLVALSSGKITRICGLTLSQSTTTTVTVSLGSGTGTNCGSTYTAKTPAWPLQGPTSVAPVGLVLPIAKSAWFQTAASEELCISTSAGVSVQALVSYTQY